MAKIEIKETWITVYFEASDRKGNSAQVELNYNHSTKSFTLCTSPQEHVSFKNDDLDIAELRVKALSAAIKYLKDKQ